MALVPEEMRPGVISDIRDDITLGLIEFPPKVDLPTIALAPACIGVVPAHSNHAVECTTCLFTEKCGELRHLAATTMTQCYGSLSPEKEKRLLNSREKTKLRVRAHRRNKKNPASDVVPDAFPPPGGAHVTLD
jgi:hypothetical protein